MSDEAGIVTIHVEPNSRESPENSLPPRNGGEVELADVSSDVTVTVETNGTSNEKVEEQATDVPVDNSIEKNSEIPAGTLQSTLSNAKKAATNDGGEGTVNLEAKNAYLQYVARLRSVIPDLPEVTIRYNDLCYHVRVPVNDLSIPSIPKAFVSMLRKFTFNKAPTREVKILTQLTGRIKPGSMTLVLGPPGCGKSAYLRALAGRLPKTPDITGTVTYNGMTDHQMHQSGVYLSKIASYVGQVDAHLPLLTVRETFQFAVDNTIADIGLLNDPQIEAVHKQRVELFIELLGLSECADTILGNQLLRGVSGGQKKRVTLGEMMISNARVLLLDEISTGLDSAVTFAIVDALQKWCRIMGGTVVMSLLQPTPEVFNLFDELVLMKDGQITYHGEINNVVPYFVRHGVHNNLDQDTADFLVDYMTIPATIYKKILRKERKVRLADNPQKSMEEKEIENPDANSTTTMVSVDAGLAERQRMHAQNEQDLLEVTKIAAKSHAPLTTDALYDAYSKSPEYRLIKEEALQLTPVNKKSTSTSTNPWFESTYSKAQYGRKYVHSWWHHTKLCTARQFKVLSRNKILIIPRIIIAIFQGIVEGSVFWNLSVDNFQARFGLTIFGLIYCAFSNISELPQAAEGKNVVYKQADAGMYPASSYGLAVILNHIPLAIVEITIFSNFLYWMASFTPEAGRFFFFWFVLICGSLAFSAIFRTISYCTANQFIAQQLDSPLVVMMMVFAGFLITYNNIRNWLVEFFWVSPFSWGVRSLLINEFGASRYDTPLQGTDERSGWAYMDTFDFFHDFAYKWAGVGYLLFVYIFFSMLQMYFLSSVRFELSRGTKRMVDDEEATLAEALSRNFVGVDVDRSVGVTSTVATTKVTQGTEPNANPQINSTPNGKSQGQLTIPVPYNQALAGIGYSRGSSGVAGASSALPFEPMSLSFQNIRYTIPIKNAPDRCLLDNINGYVEPGTLTALMGSSGAGKTTLMDLIAGRKNVGKIEGNIFVNGFPKDEKSFNRLMGYVEQTDTHMPFTTVREALEFSARLRLPAEVPKDKRDAFVEEVLELLELKAIENRIVGNDFYPGLAPGQMKLVTIGVELVTNPTFLFLDEPTSGLDSRAALIVMRGVKRIAQTGRSVLCTIHQPSAEVFFLFDKLILLQTGGKESFVGDIGHKGKDLISYFETAQPNPARNPRCPSRVNPASWMLDVLGDAKAAMQSPDPPVDYAILYKKSPLYHTALKKVEELAKPAADKKPTTFDTKYATSFLTQITETTRRSFVSYWRNTAFTFTRLLLLLMLGIIFGLVYLQLSDNTFSGLQSKISVIFLVCAFCGVVNSSTALPVLIRDRAVYYRERASFTYASLAYSFAITVVELPYIAAGSILFMTPFYFLVGFVNDAGLFFMFLLMHYANSVTYSGIGQFMSAALPNVVAATQLQGLTFFFSFLFGGVFLAPSSIPAGWHWVYYVNPLPRAVTAIGVTQFKYCESHPPCDIISFPPPLNQNMTAIQYFVDNFQTNRDSYWAMFGWLVLTYAVLRLFIVLALAYISHIKR